MKAIFLTVFLYCLLVSPLLCQPYVGRDNGSDSSRYRFAQTSIGIDYLVLPSSGHPPVVQGGESSLPSFQEMRLRIGGTHFWGHADFYLSFPLARFTTSSSDFFSPGVETGAKYYPWRMERNALRPFIGASWNVTTYQYYAAEGDTAGSGALRVDSRYPLQAGISYMNGNHVVEIGAHYDFPTEENYYTSRNSVALFRTPSWWFSFNYKYMLETTALNEYQFLNGETAKRTQELADEGKLNNISLAVGPSSSFILASSSHNSSVHPFVGQHRVSPVFPEFGVGYYYHNWDVHGNLAYRSMSSLIEAYHFSEYVERKSLTLEAYAFLWDYHGFVPFVGVGIGYEWLYLSEQEYEVQVLSHRSEKIQPCLSFGWDIRPDRLQWFILRTNLRYVPALNISLPGKGSINLEQLEFNFIQLVLYPQRLWLLF